MEETKPNNPPVYPDPMRGAEPSFSNQSPWELNQGLSLRDHFAGLAMQATVSENTNPNYFEARARDAYKMADEMLKHREL